MLNKYGDCSNSHEVSPNQIPPLFRRHFLCVIASIEQLRLHARPHALTTRVIMTASTDTVHTLTDSIKYRCIHPLHGSASYDIDKFLIFPWAVFAFAHQILIKSLSCDMEQSVVKTDIPFAYAVCCLERNKLHTFVFVDFRRQIRDRIACLLPF